MTQPPLPTGWHGRLLALALLLAAAGIIYAGVVAQLINLYSERQDRAADERMLVARLDAVRLRLPALRAELTKLRAAADSRKLILQGGSDAIASATLQGQIEKSAAAAGVRIGSTDILPVRAEQADYRRIGLKLFVSGSYKSLLELLAKIETATPPLVVDDLTLRTQQYDRIGFAGLDTMDASLEVYGFRAGGEKPAVQR